MDIYFALQSDSDGTPLLNQAANTTVYISKDGGSYAATTNAVVEIGRGSYKVELTSVEATFSDVLIYQPVCPGAQTNTLTIEKPTDVSNLATKFDLSAVASDVTDIKAKTDALPEHPAAVGSEMALTSAAIAAAQNGLAKSDALSTVDSIVDAIKAKTDNLPQSPAAVGSAMTLTEATVSTVRNNLATISTIEAAVVSLSSGLDTLAGHGDTYWSTADVSGLSTFNASTDAVTLTDAYDAAKTASQLTTYDLSALATSAELTAASASLTTLINLLLSGLYHWQVNDTIMTVYNASDVAIGAYTLTKDTTGNITAVTPIVQQTSNSEE